MNGEVHTPFTTVTIRIPRLKTKSLSRAAQIGLILRSELAVSCAENKEPGLAKGQGSLYALRRILLSLLAL